MPRLVPNRKRAPEPTPEEPLDDSDFPPAPPPHPYPHTRLRVRESFNYLDSAGTTRFRFVKDEYVNVNDPAVIKVWGEYPRMFEEELVS